MHEGFNPEKFNKLGPPTSWWKSPSVIVSLTLIGGLHWAWFKLQDYVPENERQDHPFVEIYKKLTKKEKQ